MKQTMRFAAFCAGLTFTASTVAAPFEVRAAPKGEATSVASKIIKYNFPSCKKVRDATRRSDGSIKARCGGNEYLVFTVFNPKEGRNVELAMNCSAAKQHLNITC